MYITINFKILQELLHDINSASIHHNNIHALATCYFEMYKVTIGISPEIMNEVFKQTIFSIMKGILHNFR